MEIKIQDIVQDARVQERALKASDIIAKHGKNTIVLFVIGNRYEAYDESAEQLNTICNYPITYNGKTGTSEFPKDSDFWVFPKMIRAGFKICIFEAGTY